MKSASGSSFSGFITPPHRLEADVDWRGGVGTKPTARQSFLYSGDFSSFYNLAAVDVIDYRVLLPLCPSIFDAVPSAAALQILYLVAV